MSLWGKFNCPTCIKNKNIIIGSIIFIIIYIDLSKNIIAKRLPAEYRIGPHNFDILSIIFGSLLGDGSVERRVTGNGTRISFSQEATHKQYLL